MKPACMKWSIKHIHVFLIKLEEKDVSFSKHVSQGTAIHIFALEVTVLITFSNITKSMTNTRFLISSEAHMLQNFCLQKVKPGMTV